jgi:hypothetical protein
MLVNLDRTPAAAEGVFIQPDFHQDPGLNWDVRETVWAPDEGWNSDNLQPLLGWFSFQNWFGFDFRILQTSSDVLFTMTFTRPNHVSMEGTAWNFGRFLCGFS